MRYLILLLLAGCSTTSGLSDYQKGCREGIEYAAPSMVFVSPEQDGVETRDQQVQAYKENACNYLESNRADIQRIRIDRNGPR